MRFTITYVLIISGPPKYVEETNPYHLTLHPVENLPDGFTISPTWGDAFLMYRDDGTLHTACSRMFFELKNDGEGNSSWRCWPFHEISSPEEAIEQEKQERQPRELCTK